MRAAENSHSEIHRDIPSVVSRLVEQRIGLNLAEPQQVKIERFINRTAAGDMDGYIRRLESGSPCTDKEWEHLLSEITVGESYFFRDKGQFSLLRDQLLPGLIQNNTGFRTLRIWSAGCAGGEEAYSLAIMLNQLLPDINRWNCHVIGTDITRENIQTAEKGIYGEWSFRGVDPAMRQRYFNQRGNKWQVCDEIRSRVKFSCGNLVVDDYPSRNGFLHDMDLIVCRNVFIYLTPVAVNSVLDKMSATLAPGGYLMTGHAELYGREPVLLERVIYPDSLVHRRRAAAYELPKSKPVPPVYIPATGKPPEKEHAVSRKQVPVTEPPSPSIESTISDRLVEAEKLYNNGDYAGAAAHALSVEASESESQSAMILAARAYADLGEYEEASKCVNQVLAVDNMLAEPRYILAHIEELNGKTDSAKALFKQVLYLSPDHIPAHLELAALYDQEGNANAASRLRRAALQVLKETADSESIEPYQLTAGELGACVERMLGDA